MSSGGLSRDSGFALLTYRVEGKSARAGLVVGDEVYDLAEATGNARLAHAGDVLANWDTSLRELRRAAETRDRSAFVGKADALALGPPVPDSGALFCAAANYRDHMLAMAAKLGIDPEPDPHDLDVRPYHFLKPTRQTLAGPYAEVALPGHAETVDWEIELVAVIGKTGRNIPVERALEHVAAYTVGIDLSARDRRHMKRPNVPDGSLFRTDFLAMKGFENSCPVGPWIVPADLIGDPQNLELKLWIDGELRQSSSTANMIFSVAEQISRISELTAVLPGDLVLTGTPAGTGAETGLFLDRGQRVTAWIEAIGTLEIRIV